MREKGYTDFTVDHIISKVKKQSVTRRDVVAEIGQNRGSFSNLLTGF